MWREAYRAPCSDGSLFSDFVTLIHGLLNPDLEQPGMFQLKFSMPHSDLKLSDEEQERWFGSDASIVFVHLLECSLEAGYLIARLYEDDWGDSEPIYQCIKVFDALRVIKPVV